MVSANSFEIPAPADTNAISIPLKSSLCESSFTISFLPLKIYSERYQQFLKKLREARIEKGYSQEKVSQLLGKPQSYISKCESGERRIDIIELADFAIIYEVNLDYFLK